MTTPNMVLTLPVVSTTVGPTWASELNTAIELVDAHDHSSGKGVLIGVAGLNINGTLQINSYDVTEVNSLSLDTRVSPPSTTKAIYSLGGDLYYRNSAGTAVQITNAGAIAGTPGAITGLGDGGSSAIFTDVNEAFSWYFSGTKYAAHNVGDIRLFPFDGSAAYTFAITLKSPTALASSFSLTLPGTLPAAGAFLSLASTGVISQTTTTSFAPIGSAMAPTFCFVGETDTGMYQTGAADTLGFASGGAVALTLTASTATFSGAIQTASGGAFKVKLLTLNTSTAASGSSNTAHGLTSTNIRGIHLTWYGATGTGAGSTIGDYSGAGAFEAAIEYGATNVTNFWKNGAGDSKTYSAIIFYV